MVTFDFNTEHIKQIYNKNGKFVVSHSFGYGLMDAAAMVRLARRWTSVTPQHFCRIRAPTSHKY